MGLNAQTSVPAFTTGQVLTAAQMTEVNTGIPVFADSTARDAAFGGSGEKVLAEGQYAYLESTNQTLVYDGSNWVSVGVAPGLVLVKTEVIGTTVGSVTVTDAFSATYDQYLLTVSGGVGSTGSNLALQLGATTTGYFAGGFVTAYAGASLAGLSDNNASSWTRSGTGSTNTIQFNVVLQDVFLSKHTKMQSQFASAAEGGVFSGFLNNTTSYTDFTITPSTGTLTGGTIRVYGYANS
jgi:hypothetical protein